VIFFLTLKFSRKNFSNNTEHGVLEQIGHNVVRHLLHTKNDVLAVTGIIGSFGGSALHMLQGTFKRASSSNFSCKSLPRENNWYELENSVCTIGSTVEAVEIMIGGGILKRPASSRSLVLRLKLYLIAKLKKSTNSSTDTCGGTIGKRAMNCSQACLSFGILNCLAIRTNVGNVSFVTGFGNIPSSVEQRAITTSNTSL